MALETPVTYISDLVSTNPATGDDVAEGDDHIRNIKSAVKATFPNVSGAVTPTHTELNYVDGVTSAIQTQIDTKITRNLVTGNAGGGDTITAARFTIFIGVVSEGDWTGVTFPASPTDGDIIILITPADAGTVGRNGKTINTAASDFTTTASVTYLCVYNNGNWSIK